MSFQRFRSKKFGPEASARIESELDIIVDREKMDAIIAREDRDKERLRKAVKSSLKEEK